MTEILRWPKTSLLGCGCRVALKTEWPGDIVMYFPCHPCCPTVTLTKSECEKIGKKWERRYASDN
jgi:hypothetical protein